ncbi:MAG: HAD-IIA family hydrolase [Ruminococcaceae bacterium]|nr:HAD-IIA family hydrolase [Oscillospiraceae bacterium]
MKDLRDIKYFLLDMDGTIYLDTTLFPGTLDFLETLKLQGKRAIYITNNSSKSVMDYVNKLKNLGISASPEDFSTSAQALVYMLDKTAPGAKIFLLGTPSLENYLEESGYTLVKEYTEDPEKRPDFVVLAFDTTLTYQKLTDGCHYIKDGVTYWATHPDAVCPYKEDFSLPDAGAFMELIKITTGKIPEFVAGKPNAHMINMFMERQGCTPSQIAVVGDRLNTDIMSAVNAGVTSVCVLSGETTKEMLSNSTVKPDYVLNSIKDLYEIIK